MQGRLRAADEGVRPTRQNLSPRIFADQRGLTNQMLLLGCEE
ncbi:hypothetical protein SBA7_340036 [Candidatus Sulfotelmatobacter sp. SbA7]|nr:hypothetical protein SBA7_340036 [Candidatus Sulfotelmatobacter sp. SbA7]